MSKVLTTFAYGPQADLLEVSLPTFRRYAAMHGYDLFIPHERETSRPFSWLKVPLLASLLNVYDTALWIDADVVIRRFDVDIATVAEAPMAMAVHRTSDGFVPNCGVWLVRAPALEFIESLWPLTGFRRSQWWWEQAAVIAALGGDPDATPTTTPAGRWWEELPYEWNPHVNDGRGIPPDCRFFHATMFADRRAAMLEWRDS